MDQSQRQLENQVDLKRLQRARQRAAAKAGKTRVSPLANLRGRGAGLGGLFGKLPK